LLPHAEAGTADRRSLLVRLHVRRCAPTCACTFTIPSATPMTTRSPARRTLKAVPTAATVVVPTLTTKGRAGSFATRKKASPRSSVTSRSRE
jgi:hypothetical protein